MSTTLKNLWEALGKEIHQYCSGHDARKRYNMLYSSYKHAADKAKISGLEAPTWRYWDLFNRTASPGIRKTSMDNATELHSGLSEKEKSEEEGFNNSVAVETSKKISKKSTLKDLKIRYLEASILSMEQKNSTATVKYDEEVEGRFQGLENKINLVIDLLTQTEQKNKKE